MSWAQAQRVSQYCTLLKIFVQCHIAGLITWSDANVFTPISQVRTLIANHLGVSIGRITDETHFTDDLGADWLDRLELIMVIEDQFVGVEITDTDFDQIEVVGDLIHYIETASTGCND